LEEKAAIQLSDKGELSETLKRLLTDKAERDALGGKAMHVVLENRGATRRNIDAIEEIAPW
jgi:3-deoxy-D-manno-octulosonic-acid transferase